MQTRRNFLRFGILAGAVGASRIFANESGAGGANSSVNSGANSANSAAIQNTAAQSAQNLGFDITKPIKCKGYAGFDESGELRPWEFERRAVGDHDILIDIKIASICHSDIHQIHGDWGKTPYPQVPGHEIAGVVVAVGAKVSKFRIGERAGVGCMVGSCGHCHECKDGHEELCDEAVYTYGYPSNAEPGGITQGGYSDKLVVSEDFAIHLPESIPFDRVAPLLCAGITTYSPIIKNQVRPGDKVGVVGIGGLGHIAVKLLVSKGATVYAFTTTPEKKDAIKALGAHEVIVVRDSKDLAAYKATLDYMIATVPEVFDITSYATCVRPGGTFTLVGLAKGFEARLQSNVLGRARGNFNASYIGGIPQTQEVIDYCARNGIAPEVQIIEARQIPQAWRDVVAKKARFRYVIDTATL